MDKPTPLNILIIEDNPVAYATANKLLIDCISCTLQHADTAAAAFELLQKEKFNLIFMDIGLPDLSGNEITQSLRQGKAPLNKNTPIIGLTIKKDSQEKQKSIDAGMNAILSKPLTVDAIKTVFNHFNLV